jgi:hypothetical protein
MEAPQADDADKVAQRLIAENGDKALTIAAAQVRVAVARDDIAGAAAWALIRERIKVLLMTPGG